jgi:hypothetical protein
MALDPFSANWLNYFRQEILGQAQRHSMKRYTIPCATLIGANAVFIQIGKRYTPFPALFQFFLNKLVFCAQVEAKRFFF